MIVLKWMGIVLGGLVGVAAAAVVMVVLIYDWNDARGLVAEQASKALGREVRIEGDLHVGLSDPLRIQLSGVKVANTEWGHEPNFAELGTLDLQLRFWPLLRGSWEIPEITLTRPILALEKNEQGAKNWTFGPGNPQQAAAEETAPDDRSEMPIIGRLTVREGRVRYRDPTSDIDLNSKIETASGDNAEDRVRLAGEGSFAGKRFTLVAEGGSLEYLRDDPKPYPVRLEAAIGETKSKIEGAIGDPIKMQNVDLSIDLKGDDLAAVFPIFGIPTPKTRAYSLSGHLTREGAVWKVEGLKGKVGDSDLNGWLSADTGGQRMMVTGDVTSKRLAALDLAGLVGASPKGTGDYETKARDRVIPDTMVSLERLRTTDMDVRFRGEKVEAPHTPLNDLDVRFHIDNGRLTMDPLKLGIAGGRIAGSAVLDGREDIPALRADLQVSRVQLAEFFRGTSVAREMGGVIAGQIKVAGRGRTVADIMAVADGDVGLAVNGGRVTNLAEAGLKTNILETLGILISGDEPIRFNCLVADLRIRKGQVTTDAIVFDTDEALVTGKGKASLRDETLGLTIGGESKQPQIFATHVPVTVKGKFLSPQVSVQAGESIARGAAAVALGALLTPLAAILPMIDTGTEQTANCAGLVNQAQTPDNADQKGNKASGSR